MRDREVRLLGRISGELAAIAREVTPTLAALGAGLGGHVSGFLWNPGLLVGAGRAEGEVAMLSGGRTVRIARLETGGPLGIAAFRLPVGERGAVALPRAEAPACVGALVLAFGAAADTSPTMRLMVVGRANADGVRLDGPLDPAAEGGPVLDAEGHLLGMALAAPDGGCELATSAAIAAALSGSRPGWIGVAFQPTLVAASLRGEAGQDSGRLVVRVAKGGPAEEAGLVVGDTVLALDGIGLTGTGTLRGFLARAQPGRRVAARLVRGGRITTATLVVGADPDP